MSTQPVTLAESPGPASEQVLVLEAGRADRHYWADLWLYRELFFILAWRDVSLRLKQPVIGVLWTVLRPCLTLVIFTVIFGRLAGLLSDGTSRSVAVAHESFDDTLARLTGFDGRIVWDTTRRNSQPRRKPGIISPPDDVYLEAQPAGAGQAVGAIVNC